MCEMFKNAYKNEALSCMHAFKCLKKSQMRALMTIHQLHKIWTQLQQLMNWCLSNYSMTWKLMEDQLHINRQIICHILYHDVCCGPPGRTPQYPLRRHDTPWQVL